MGQRDGIWLKLRLPVAEGSSRDDLTHLLLTQRGTRLQAGHQALQMVHASGISCVMASLV